MSLALGSAALVLTALAAPAAARVQDAERGEQIRARVVAMRPPAERWQEIPWRSDLREARREAERLGLPIYLWAMNGDPLGCT